MNDDPALANHVDSLLTFIRRWRRCLVAFSAGVDSTVVAQAAHLALGQGAVAVTAASPSLPDGELEEARRLASLIGIRHEVIVTDELEDPNYTKNDPSRCYHCKSKLFDQVGQLASRFEAEVIFSGTNADDLKDFRPGLTAAAEKQVESPLASCGLGKEQVRALATHWQLPVADKPAAPCLSSRIAYGEEVTAQRLAMIDQAEQRLRSLGIREARVRYHRGDLARIEVPMTDFALLNEDAVRRWFIEEFRSLGFKYVTLDLEGFRSGSQNLVLDVEVLRPAAPRGR